MIFLGIDPGFSFTGYGILKAEANKAFLLDCGCLRLTSNKSLQFRIDLFYKFFSQKIIEYQVTDLTLETPFLGKNAQSFLKLGYLRGVLYLLAEQRHLNIKEFSPREVKQAITGYGGASKEQVARAVFSFFPKMNKIKKNDITDAVAIMLCGYWKKNCSI